MRSRQGFEAAIWVGLYVVGFFGAVLLAGWVHGTGGPVVVTLVVPSVVLFVLLRVGNRVLLPRVAHG